MEDSTVTKLEALITIMDYGLRNVLSKVFSKSNMPLLLLTHGYGSAKSTIYDILGYGGPKKIVSCIQTKNMSHFILRQLQRR